MCGGDGVRTEPGGRGMPGQPRQPAPQPTDALAVTSTGCPHARRSVTAEGVMQLGQGCCGQGGCGGVRAWVCLCPKPIGPRASGPPPLPPAPRELSQSLRHPARGHPALGHLVNSAETRVWPFVPALLGARGAHVSAARPWPPAEGRARPFLPLGHVCRVGMARQRPLRGSDLLSLDPQSLHTG